MAVDLRINRDFDIELDHRNDIPLVEGREAFEQHLSVAVTKFFHDVIGVATGRDNITRKVELQARRVAARAADTERVVGITVEQVEDSPNTLEVSVLYDTGEETTFEVQ